MFRRRSRLWHCRHSAPGAVRLVQVCRSALSHQLVHLGCDDVLHRIVQPAETVQPSLNVRGIGVVHHFGRSWGMFTDSIEVERGGVESEHGAMCRAEPPWIDVAEHQCACREARAVDDDFPTGRTPRIVLLGVIHDVATAVARDDVLRHCRTGQCGIYDQRTSERRYWGPISTCHPGPPLARVLRTLYAQETAPQDEKEKPGYEPGCTCENADRCGCRRCP